jgi:recombinational DNA repair protein (RecF pathway)
VRERVIAHLAAMLPGLDAKTAHDVLAASRADEGRALRELDAHFREYPDALAATPAEFPLALVRVAHALIEAGHRPTAVPACAGCGKITPDLRRKTASGRVCAACAASRDTGTCARCGRTKRIDAWASG